MEEFDELTEITVAGKQIRIIWNSGLSVPVIATSVAIVVLVSNDLEELQSTKAYLHACEQLLKSAARRELTPEGQWCMNTLPLDWPLWRDYLGDADMADRIAATVAKIDGHIAVFSLADSANMKILDLDQD